MSERTPLSTESISTALSELPGWRHEDNRLTKRFTFASFREAIGFIVRLAFEAESTNHHPELVNVYNRVDVALTTHDAGDRVTESDVRLAKAIEQFSWTT